MTLIYGTDIHEHSSDEQLIKHDQYKKESLKKPGSVKKMSGSSYDSDEYALQLDYECVHIVHYPRDTIGLPIQIMSIDYEVWEKMIKWYLK